jgi:hypothetical protein
MRHEGLYLLPSEAINEFKAQLIHIIQDKLKGHFSQLGKQTISLPYLESLFFKVFEGYIHYYNYQTGSYKCFFQGPDAYTQIANLFGNSNWDANFLIITNKLLLCYLIRGLKQMLTKKVFLINMIIGFQKIG